MQKMNLLIGRTLLTVGLLVGYQQLTHAECRSMASAFVFQSSDMGEGGENDAVLLRLKQDPSLAIYIDSVVSSSPRFSRNPWRQVRTTKISRDYGRTWERVDRDAPSSWATNGVSLLQSPSQEQVMYKFDALRWSYLRSTDGGRTWVRPHYIIEGHPEASSMTVDARLLAIHPDQPLTLFAAIRLGKVRIESDLTRAFTSEVVLPGLYLSVDGGNTWKPFASELSTQSALGIAPSNPLHMVGKGKNGLWETRDGGHKWNFLATIAPPRLQIPASSRGYTWPSYVDTYQIAFDPTNERTIYLNTNFGLLRSQDGGAAWCLADLGFDRIDAIHSIGINDRSPKEVFVGTEDGLFFSRDSGDTFRRIYPGIRP